MELFSGPFLITYFIKLSAESTVTISVYQIFCDVGIAVGSYFVGRLLRNHFKLGMYRLSIFMNLIYIIFFIVLADRVLNYVPLIALMYGISAACYWYPINLLKSTKISDEERPVFFARDRITVTSVSVIGPLILGTMITRLTYRQTAFTIAGISMIQLVVSFILRPVPPTDNPPFKMREAWKCFIKDNKFKHVMSEHFCMGLNFNGGALSSVAMINLMNAVGTDQKVGVFTSIANVLVIAGVMVFSKAYKNRDPKYFIYGCGFIPVMLFLIQYITASPLFAILFYIVYNAGMSIIMPTHNVFQYSVLARGNIGLKYREEFFTVSELILGVGRIAGYTLLLIAGLSGNAVIMGVVSWIMVISVFMNTWFINHFQD